MPETPASRARKAKAIASKNRPRSKFANAEIKDDADSVGNTQEKIEDAGRRQETVTRKQESAENSETEDDMKDNEALDPEDKLVICLVSCLTECSRQRLRALHMSLRHYGNVDSRVTVKDFQASLQANQIKLTQRVLQMITEIFEDSRGIDYERLYQCMARAHLRTGRDSIKASNKRNDLKRVQEKTIEEIDNDFLRRLEEQIVKEQTYFDIDVLRSEFYKYDNQGLGKMNKEGAYLICCEKTPLYGALLKNLINRCDEDKDMKMSWPLFLNFLDTAQKSAWEKYPELSSLQQKGREKASVRITTPEPIDELSSTTKTKVVNKLLKKNPSSADMTSDLQEFKLLAVHRKVVAKATEEGENPDLAVQDDAAPGSIDGTQQPSVQPQQAGNTDAPGHSRILKGILQKLTIPDESARMSQDVAVDKEVTERATDHKGERTESKARGKLHSSSSKTSVLGNEQNRAPGKLHSSSSKTSVLGHAQSLAQVPDILKQDAAKTTQSDVADITQQDVIDIPQQDMFDSTQQDVIASTKQDVIASTKQEVIDTTQQVVSDDKQDVASVEPHKTAPETAKTLEPSLQLEWIYGFCNHSGTCNLVLLTSGEMMYFIASNIVMYNRKLHQQRHYREHTENVECLTVHSDGILVASGQCARLADQRNTAQVRVWRADTLQTLHVLGEDGVFGKTMSSLSFMPAYNILVTVSDCPDTKLTVWNTQTGVLKAQTAMSVDLVSDLQFNPWISETLVTCGTEHLVWWTVSRDTGQINMSSQPNYDTYLKGHIFTCLCHSPRGDVISGDSKGSVYIWGNKGASILKIIKYGHQGPVTDLVLVHNHLLSSGQDGAICCWTMGKSTEKESILQLPKSEGGVRSLLLLPGTKGPVLVVGTTTNSLIHVTLNQHKSPLADVALENVPITQGHTGELRALNVIRESFLGADIVSASTDGLICKRNSKNKEAVWKLWMKGYPFICVVTNPEGDQIFLGTQDGKLVILSVVKEDLTVVEILNETISNGPVYYVSLRPDESVMAAVGADMGVHIYSRLRKSTVGGTAEVWAYAGKCKGNTRNIDAINWCPSAAGDGYELKTSSCLQERQIWKVPACIEVAKDKTNSTSRPDFLQWLRSAQTGQGEVTCAAVSPAEDLVAVASSDGQLTVVRRGEDSRTNVTPMGRHLDACKLCFTSDGRSLLSVGGADVCIMQWKVV